ncbi:DddA-like double-stranded DNA deaminase toxin [Streptomyces sp. NPDC101178]|uniref:DddA-like double-stranded DNA deaminase toxin n=1 Tax=Streptomyces sp. NPDC101178 TaxID=3366124 RepID=UPI003810F79F
MGRAGAAIRISDLVKGAKETIRALPFKKGGKTQGLGVYRDARIHLVNSGNKAVDDDLWRIANERLREVGIRRGSATSATASDVEQKFVAMMIRDKVNKAEVVINNPSGPCRQPMGCDAVLNTMLGERQLRVHWPNGRGGFTSHLYGNGNVGMGGR